MSQAVLDHLEGVTNKCDGNGATSAAMATPLFAKEIKDFFHQILLPFFLHFNSYILLRKSTKVLKKVGERAETRL